MVSTFLLGTPPFFFPPSHFSRKTDTCLPTHIASTPTPQYLRTRNNYALNSKPATVEVAVKVFDESSQSKSISTNELDITEHIQDSQFSTNSAIGVASEVRNICNIHQVPEPEKWGGTPHWHSLINDLKQFTTEGRIKLGEGYHALIIKVGLIHDKFVVTSLVNMYVKCGTIEDACKLFHCSTDLEIVCYNSLISGYARIGSLDKALGIFVQAQNVGLMPSDYTFTIVLSVCGTALAIEEGKQLHGFILKMQYLKDAAVGNALLTMYSKCGMMEEVKTLFEELPCKNHISWTAVITGFYHHKHFKEALGHFTRMRQSGIAPNEHTYTIAFASCGGIGLLDYGKTYHALAIKNGMSSGTFVGTSIVDMYSGLGEMSDAERHIEDMGEMSSEVSWNALLAGYVGNGKNVEALDTFTKMLKNGIACDHFTYSNILKACSSLPSLASGEQIHSQVIKTNSGLNLHVGSSLVEMYANCGDLASAELIFCEMPKRDIVSWNSIIKACSLHGCPERALTLFRKMIQEGIKPTSATFLTILSSCSHSGLIQDGQELFKSMVQDFNISPEEKHYSCIVDLLGRAGKLEEARDFINNLHIGPNASLWRPLLAACRYHNHLQMAEFVAARILDIDPSDPTVYVTLSNMYAEIERWGDVGKQRELMKLNEVKKEPGFSWIEVDNKLHRFYSGDITHNDTRIIYERVYTLAREMKNLGYVPDINIVLDQG